MLRHIENQTKTMMEQSVEQAGQYISFYFQSMEYVSEILGSNAELLELLEQPDFGMSEDLMEGYTEFYFLNKIFQEIEVYNSNFRIGLYVPDSAYYADNNYYFYPESSLTELDESGAILEKLENGETVYVILQDKSSSDPDSVCDYLACLSAIEVTNEDGMTSSYIIKTEVQVNVFEEILDSASMTQNSLLYLTGEDTEIQIGNGNHEKEWEFPSIDQDVGNWGRMVEEGKTFYCFSYDEAFTNWKVNLFVPVREFYQYFLWFFICMIVIAAGIVCVVLVTSNLLSRYYSERIDSVNEKIHVVQNGNISLPEAKLQENSKDELDLLSSNFDRMIEELQQLMKEQYRLGRKVSKSEMKALQSQINPHFLYNTLDLINWSAMEYGADEAAELARNLGQFYRLSLNHGKTAISIEDEIRHIQTFVNIENVHYDGAILLEVHVPDELLSYGCLNIILQPFVENSIVHGIGEHPEIKSCRIEVAAVQEGEDIIFTVRDDGPGIDAQTAQRIVNEQPGEGKNGYGIANVNFRIKLTYGEKYGVSYRLHDQNDGTEVVIRIKTMQVDELEQNFEQ